MNTACEHFNCMNKKKIRMEGYFLKCLPLLIGERLPPDITHLSKLLNQQLTATRQPWSDKIKICVYILTGDKVADTIFMSKKELSKPLKK